MIDSKYFYQLLRKNNINFFAGVPDSTLKYFCNYVTQNHSDNKHFICANEGGAIALGVGYHLSTGKIPAIYMQNSGIGNSINPLVSIADEEVYSIPMLLLIGWRGKPGYIDEPQHIKQGKITLGLLEVLGIPYEVVDTDVQKQVSIAINKIKKESKPFALIFSKGSFQEFNGTPVCGSDNFSLTREESIKIIVDSLKGDEVIVSTTGMASRELFEYREQLGKCHENDFLTVGGMGHASKIALGIAMQKPDKKIYCLDGDGALIMHMGACAINGTSNCKNFVHILLNNGSHDSVGGQCTVGFKVNFKEIAKASGYNYVKSGRSKEEIKLLLKTIQKKDGPVFLEIFLKPGHRDDLGRPFKTPIENKKSFMEFLE